MRKRGKTDANQAEIVRDLRAIGASVWITSGCGNGAPDLVVGYAGHNFCMEIKDWNQIPSKKRLTSDEKVWHEEWKGTVQVVESFKDALLILGQMPRRSDPSPFKPAKLSERPKSHPNHQALSK